MQDFAGKVAFITGGGSGVGLGQAKVFARAGARIVLADIRPDHLDRALNYFRDLGAPVHGIHLDVTDRAAFERAAQETERTVGPVQLLFNTAGVSMFGPLEKSTYEDYDWMMGVNFGGVVNGIQTFVPRMIERGKGGYIVNTASMSGLIASGPAGIYSASKFAVVGLSQALRQALDRYDIGVSVLCPGNVNTNIAESTRTRPEHLGQHRLSHRCGRGECVPHHLLRRHGSGGSRRTPDRGHAAQSAVCHSVPGDAAAAGGSLRIAARRVPSAGLGCRRREEAPGRDDAFRQRAPGDRSAPQVGRQRAARNAAEAPALSSALMSLIWMIGGTLE